MDLSQELDDYIKESIDYSIGLPVSTQTLELKLRASEEARNRLRDQYSYLQMRLKEKDEAIERTRVCTRTLLSLKSISISVLNGDFSY